MSDEHSQLPWTWHPRSHDQQHEGSVYRIDRPGHAYAIAMQPRYVEDAQWKADADLIVRSVNALPDLVKALEEIAAGDTAYLKTKSGQPQKGYPGWWGHLARTALAKVKE